MQTKEYTFIDRSKWPAGQSPRGGPLLIGISGGAGLLGLWFRCWHLTALRWATRSIVMCGLGFGVGISTSPRGGDVCVPPE
jgi:hypothetical protein